MEGCDSSKGDRMIFIEQVREGLEIVGSNGVHVGTVDALSGTLLKLNP
jgi:hypothetical protein